MLGKHQSAIAYLQIIIELNVEGFPQILPLLALISLNAGCALNFIDLYHFCLKGASTSLDYPQLKNVKATCLAVLRQVNSPHFLSHK